MNRQWRYFTVAALIGAYLLLSHGAPLLAVALGISGAALFLRLRNGSPLW